MKKDYNISEQTYNNLLQYLSDNLVRGRLTPSQREFHSACPFCGDSKSDSNARSFYINIDPSSDKFLNYHCFRANCYAKGVVNEDFLSMIGFSDSSLLKEVNKFNSSRLINIDGKYITKKSKTLYNIINSTNEVSDAKLSYINNRLGLKLTYNDLYNLKINLSLNELLKFNSIDIPQNKINKYNKLSDYGISFISAYNDYVIVRDVSKSNKLKMRYTNVNIFDNYDNVTKAYRIPTKIDLLDPEPCVINIAEGTFDIIGVYYNLNIDKKYNNQIFMAACGAGIVPIIKQTIRQYGLINCKINIFSDADVDISKYNDLYILKNYLKKFDVTVYYNTIEKDFGVSKKNIKIIKSKL